MADTLLGNLVWKITGDTKDFDKSVGSSEKTLGSFLTKSVIKGNLISDAAKQAGRAVIDFIKSSIDVSVAAQEQISKYGSVFAGTGEQAEDAAKKFADSFGLAGSSAKEMLSATGNLLQGMGATREESLALSVEVNTLASDLSSFTNNEGGATAASAALTKALLGERESMKTLGIAILDSDVNLRVAKNGKDQYTGTALKMAKAEATLQLITEQSKNAIGDYARTQDSAANSQKRAEENTKKLQVAIGEALNPAIILSANLWSKVSSALADVIGKQNELKGAQKAEEAGNATIAQRLLLLQHEKELYIANTENIIAQAKARNIDTAVQEKYLKDGIQSYDNRIAGMQRFAAEADKANELNNKAKEEELARINAEIAAQERQAAIDKETADAAQAQIDGRKKALQDYQVAVAIAQDKTNAGLTTEQEERDAIASAAQAQIDALYALGYSATETASLGGQEIVKMIDLLNTLNGVRSTGAEEEAVQIEKSIGLWDDWEANASKRLENIYNTGMGSLMTGFGDIGEAIAQNELDWKVFAKSGLNALAAIVEAMGHELLAQAAKSIAFSWSTFGASLVGVAPALSGAAAAYTGAGIIRGFAGSFEDGGIVPGTSYTGDKMVAAVNSGEEILRRDDPRNSANGGSSSTIVIQLDGNVIAKSTVKLVNNGQYLIKAGSVI